ncbi:[histone H3]-lysine(4) N-trimethyltransferase [Salvia divinorum]|uniref:[histone H3]-lysine(4) N-trimethyltransferase n=1 Tax=Salvia divinorum TaxID=28513 RepID=A0ABD1GII9_SALDI
MNLHEHGNMFRETKFGEDICGIKDESFMIDFDLDIGKLSVSPQPYQSSSVAADISSLIMVESKVSGSDILSAFDSICVHESLEQKNCVAPDNNADTFDSVGQAYMPIQCPANGNDTCDLGSSDLAVVSEPSIQGDAEANKALAGIDKTCTQSHSLIVYTSSRRRSAHNTKSSQMNKLPNSSKFRTTVNKSSDFDLSFLPIRRRSRSLSANRARSSVWGDLGTILPDIDQSSVLDKRLGNERKQRRHEKGGKGKRKGTREQIGKKSLGKSLVPTGRISLKIKIGNKLCTPGNVAENFSAPGKDITGFVDTKGNKLGEEVPREFSAPCERNLEKVMPSDVSAISVHLKVKGTLYNNSLDTSSNFHEIRNLEEADNSRTLTKIQCSDVGTSPDSEVINSIPDVSLCEKGLPDLQDGFILSKARVSPVDISNLILSPKHAKKEKKKVKHHQVDSCVLGNKLNSAGTRSNATEPASVKDVSSSSPSCAKPYLNGEDMKPCSNSPVCDTLIPCSNDLKNPKCSGTTAKGSSKGRSRTFRNDKGAAPKKNGNINSLDGNETPYDLGGTGAFSNGVTGPINTVRSSIDGTKEQYDPPRNAWVLCDKCQKWRRIQAALADKIEETNRGWTCRDNTDKDFADCSIPQEKSNSDINEELEISDEEDACRTFAKLNQDRSKVAQQSSWTLIKSNLFLHRSRKTQTIDDVMVCHCKPPSDGRMGCGDKCLNRMLNIECVQGTCPCGELCSNQQFQRRNYSKLKWIRCGKKGYGLQALEDMPQGQFLIEYVGEVLNVHAYEARQRDYGMMGHRHFYFMTLNGSEVIDACAKGNLGRFINHSCDPNCRTEKWMVNGEVCIGLFSLRDIKKEEEITFDYNFVRLFGAAAKKCECGSANCRGYIGGDLTNSEVIAQDDSDDEYTEPVMTCDERDMSEDWNAIILNNPKDEIAKEPSENIYRVKKFISAVDSLITSHTSETSPQLAEGDDSARVEIRVTDGFGVYDSIGNNSTANVVDKLNNNSPVGEFLKESTPAGRRVEYEGIVSQKEDLTSKLDGIVNKSISSTHEKAIGVSHSKSLSDKVECKRNLKYATVEGRSELAKSNCLTKTKCLLSSIKKGKPKLNVLKDKLSPDVSRLNSELHRSKKLPKIPLSHHLEAVEGKLNELLDPEGGISKRIDASRGYLKLLLLTAATGNNGHGEAIQSNRDLSMILDALLKTKSRTVLVDIINKNGLHMLHNILKRYRKEFIKTPILRKLLKVLEYLATREILTLEHITGGPVCPGVESFKDSVLALTEHADKQVHQIARNFRDKWIPRSLRKTCCMEREDGAFEYQQPTCHGGLSVLCDHWRGGKPTEATNSIETQPVAASGTAETFTVELSAAGSSCRTSEPKTHKRKSRWDNPAEHPQSRCRNNLVGEDNEDIPPGFGTPCNGSMIPADAPSTAPDRQEREMQMKQRFVNIVLGEPQLRFSARKPITYGVPYSIMQQFEVPQAEISDGWTIAPGVPFHPFPPLPPCAPVERDRSTSARCASLSAPIQMAGQSSDTCLINQTYQQNTKTCNMDSSHVSVAIGRPDFQQGGSCSLGRKFFRQQKFTHSKLPPWVRMRNGWGSAGNKARIGLPGVGLVNSNEDYRKEFFM